MQAKRRFIIHRGRVLLLAISILLLAACQPEPDAPEGSAEDAIPYPTPERAEPEPRSGSGPEAATDADAETASSGNGSQCELTVGWDPWEPYHYLAIGGEPQGLDIEIVRAVADQADCDLTFLQGGWDGLLRLLRTGELDLMLGATRTPAREAWARFSEPYRSETFRLYVLERLTEDYAGQDLASLLESGFRLGITQGYYYGPEVAALVERPAYDERILEAAVGELNLTRLLDMQIDGFIEDPFVFAAIERRRRDSEPIVALPRDLTTGQVSFMFSRDSVDADVVERFDAGLAALQASGRHQELLDQYLE